MFGANFQRKYALTDQGVQNTKKGTFWTVIVNLVVMGGVSILYLVMSGLMETLTDDASLPASLPVLAGLAAFALLSFLTHLQQYKATYGLVYGEVKFALLSFLTHLQQYKATYGLVYGEVKTTRLRLAERLRKLPLGFFGKRDLADLTETLMGDVNRMEHVWSHVLGYLYGSYISTAVIAVCLLWYDWRLALACLWGVPVAFGLLFGAAGPCLPLGGAGGLRPAVWEPEAHRASGGTDQARRCAGLGWNAGGAGKCAGNSCHQSGGAIPCGAVPEGRRP